MVRPPPTGHGSAADNGTTAMTGLQEHPALGGAWKFAFPACLPEALARAMGVGWCLIRCWTGARFALA